MIDLRFEPKKLFMIVSLTMLLIACDEDNSGIDARHLKVLYLSAFTDFKCDSVWTNRDGSLGIRAGDGAGICEAPFIGASGFYRIRLVAQTEFDGAPLFKISVNDIVIKEGEYPYSTDELVCDCPGWRKNCPDKKVNIDTKPVLLKQGDMIMFSGEEVYPCGTHGAYAKWHGMEFVPVE